MGLRIQEYYEKMQNIQTSLLNFFDNESDIEENFQNLCNTFDDINIRDNLHEFKILLYMVSSISNNHHRCSDFFNKIERILQYLKEDIIKNLPNSQIFKIFKENKRVLLFLFDEKIIKIDENIIYQIIENQFNESNFLQYFSPEIKPFINYLDENKLTESNRKLIEKELPENFTENRKIGENESQICQIIRSDSVRDFIAYVNKNDISLNATIELSVYETNPFLYKEKKQKRRDMFNRFRFYNFHNQKDEINLIKYAAFHGSNQIFQYLSKNGVNLESSIWLYAIHGQNAEIIRILEDNKIEPENSSFRKCFKESIKCHHNDIARYIQNNFLNEKEVKDLAKFSIKYYNSIFIESSELRFSKSPI